MILGFDKIAFADNDKGSLSEGVDSNLEWEAEFGLPLMKFLNQSWETLIRLPSKASSRPPHLAAVMLTRDQRRAEGGSGLSGAETGRGGSVVVPVHVGQEAIYKHSFVYNSVQS